MTDPQKAKYIVHDPNIEETYYCESEAEALAIAKEALENIWPEKDEGIYIATLTVTPTHKAVIADEWEYEDGDEGREYRIEKVQTTGD